MAQQDIEVILARHLASYLAMPIFIVDPEGTLLFYNSPAESILGPRFDETGAMPVSEWSTIFRPTETDGTPLAPEDLPLWIALRERRPAHRSFWIYGLDQRPRFIEITCFPLIGQAGRSLGAIALFWECPPA
jgi:PAS domain-containing protein